MNKQLLSIMSLVALAVTQSSIRLVAAPSDGPGSAADSDRKFLNKLENKAGQSAPAESAPEPQVVPAPVQPAAPKAPSAPPLSRSQAVAEESSNATAPVETSPSRPKKSVTRPVAAAPRTDPRTVGTQTRTTATAPVRREVVEEQNQTGDAQSNEGPGVSAKIYRSRPTESVVATSPRSATRKTPRNVTPEEEGTHIVQPAEVAQYGVAPTVPTKTTKVTTTYVQPSTTVVRKEDHDEDRDEDHVNHSNDHNFFHRLFHGGLFNKHGND